VRATNIRVEAIKSQEAGIASHNGLMLVFCFTRCAYVVPGEAGVARPSLSFELKKSVFTAKNRKQLISPTNINAV
jgi:hypothetical protein